MWPSSGHACCAHMPVLRTSMKIPIHVRTYTRACTNATLKIHLCMCSLLDCLVQRVCWGGLHTGAPQTTFDTLVLTVLIVNGARPVRLLGHPAYRQTYVHTVHMYVYTLSVQTYTVCMWTIGGMHTHTWSLIPDRGQWYSTHIVAWRE